MFKGRTRSKYGAKRVELMGVSFASKLEAALFGHLKLLEMGGEIEILKTQDRVKLSDAQIIYIPDFKIFDKQKDCIVWCEAKGFETERWPIVKKLWKCYGPGPLRVYKGTHKRLFLAEEIIP